MGSVCCVAVKDRKVPPSGGPASSSVHRNSACSPQWSFRRDNRRRVADEIEGSPYYSPYVASRGISMDKMSLGSERGTLSEGGTPPDGHLGTPASQKSATPEMSTNSMVPPSSGNSFFETMTLLGANSDCNLTLCFESF
ncbi:hypothetical protein AXX17_AT1G69860 [Arabidopsis thaliana]|uniref:Uncharacterized protein n=1 Tax=Arabidopsis thaliana TaxID=3702 RepID=A0A178WAR9_ARATH|nr:hypothetical protein AXX17_AT1G69860 [Arabidopsis thaliana]